MINTRLNRSLLVVALAVAGIGIVNADPAKTTTQNKLVCFEDFGGRCTLKGLSAKLNTTAGGDAGVYPLASTVYGQLLTQVRTLSFTYSGSAADTQSPRFIVPIDTDGDGNPDQYASVAAFSCNNGTGLVDAIGDKTCAIDTSDSAGAFIAHYANWAALAAALTGARINDQDPVIVVVDSPGIWTVKNVRIAK